MGHRTHEGPGLVGLGEILRGPAGHAAGIPMELVSWNPLARDNYRIAGEAFEFMEPTRCYPEEDVARFRCWAEGHDSLRT
jgi:hypothetical protein